MHIRVVIALSALALLVTTAELTAQVKNYEAPGNLESMNDIGCVGSAKLQNTYTPADLYRAAELCVRRATYREAAFLYAMAGVYGRYDTLRVADKTAHQALTVLQMQAFGALGQGPQEAFKKAIKESLGSPAGLAAACKEIQRIGPPAYHPRYMIQHGMGAFTKDGPTKDGSTRDGLVTPFDASAAWKRSLDTYLHCPGP